MKYFLDQHISYENIGNGRCNIFCRCKTMFNCRKLRGLNDVVQTMHKLVSGF